MKYKLCFRLYARSSVNKVFTAQTELTFKQMCEIFSYTLKLHSGRRGFRERSLASGSFTATWTSSFDAWRTDVTKGFHTREEEEEEEEPVQHPRRFLVVINIMWLQLYKKKKNCPSVSSGVFHCLISSYFLLTNDQHSIAAHYFHN